MRTYAGRKLATACFLLLGSSAAWCAADAIVDYLQPVPLGLPVWPAFLVLCLPLVAWPIVCLWSEE